MRLKKIKLPVPNRLTIVLISLIIGIALGIAFTTIPLLANFTLPKLAFLASKISQYTPQQTVKIDPLSEPSISPTPNLPSDKALKIAAFLVVRGNEQAKKESKLKYGDGNMSDTELIKRVASGYDTDPVKMAEKEALMQKITAQENQPVYNYTSEQSSQVDTSEIERKIRQQQGDLEQLQSDMRFDCIMGGGVPSGGKCL